MDPRVDGLFFFEVSWQDRPWAHYGRYLRAEAPRRLKFTWTSEATQGLESIVNSELGRGHEEGWKAIVAEISRAMEADP